MMNGLRIRSTEQGGMITILVHKGIKNITPEDVRGKSVADEDGKSPYTHQDRGEFKRVTTRHVGETYTVPKTRMTVTDGAVCAEEPDYYWTVWGTR